MGIGNVNENNQECRKHLTNNRFDFLSFYSTIRNLKRTTLRASRFRFFCFCGWTYRKEIIAGSGEVSEKADLVGGEVGGDVACGGEGEGDGCG